MTVAVDAGAKKWTRSKLGIENEYENNKNNSILYMFTYIFFSILFAFFPAFNLHVVAIQSFYGYSLLVFK